MRNILPGKGALFGKKKKKKERKVFKPICSNLFLFIKFVFIFNFQIIDKIILQKKTAHSTPKRKMRFFFSQRVIKPAPKRLFNQEKKKTAPQRRICQTLLTATTLYSRSYPRDFSSKSTAWKSTPPPNKRSNGWYPFSNKPLGFSSITIYIHSHFSPSLSRELKPSTKTSPPFLLHFPNPSF